MAVRTRKPIDIRFPPMVWKLIAGVKPNEHDLETIDFHYMKVLREIRDFDSGRGCRPERGFEDVLACDSFQGVSRIYFGIMI